MATSKSILNNVREVHFYRDSAEISPGKIVDRLYYPLNKLIEWNRQSMKRVRKSNSYEEVDKEEQNKLYIEVIDKVHNSKGLSALLTLDNNEKRLFNIRARTNFYPSLTKTPNILYLVGQKDDSTIILRESRGYKNDPLVHSDAREISKNNYIEDISILRDHKNSNPKAICSIPEPHLILGLEKIYQELNLQRITPAIKVIGVGEDKIWSLRNFLPSAKDGHLDLHKFFSYEGTLNGLSLMDVLDNQVAHYCINGKDSIVNIDPDFLTYTSCEKHINHIDFQKFKEMFKKHFLIGKKIDKELKKCRIETINQVKDKLGSNSLLDYLPSNLMDAEALNSLATENYK